jgi:hypothetical protein
MGLFKAVKAHDFYRHPVLIMANIFVYFCQDKIKFIPIYTSLVG